MHELAASAHVEAGPHLELVPRRQVDEVTLIRCPTCKGLRTCYARHERRQSGRCKDCRDGRVVTREDYFGFWLEHFDHEQIAEMGRAIESILGS